MSTCHPVGSALPPRRDLISASATDLVTAAPLSTPMVIPQARDRSLEFYQRRMSPMEVAAILEASTTGSLLGQHLLFHAMLDSWPRFQKCMNEVKRSVRNAPWKVTPWSNRRTDPSKSAQERADFVEDAIWGMIPTQEDVVRKRKGFEGMVELIAEGYYTGHQVIDLIYDDAGKLPQTAAVLSARFYGYPWEGEDRLMFDPIGLGGTRDLVDFPPHKVLVAINGSHGGNPVAAAPIRALTGYWLAATFGLKWFLSYCEKFGQPVRWAEYAAGDLKAKAEIEVMMQNIGANAWGVFPSGTKLNFVESAKSAAGLPQRELVDLADEQCDIYMLGQTLTSSQGDRGSQSLGEVHMKVRDEVVRGVCDFVGEVLSYQLAPSIVALNFGGDGRSEMPGIWAVWPEAKDEKAMAERDNTLGVGTKIPVGKKWFYERHSIPVPGPDEELFEPLNMGGTDPTNPVPPGEVKPGPGLPAQGKVQAADASVSWATFRDDLGSLNIPRAEMPQIKSGDRAAMVQFLRSRGIDTMQHEVPADSLKPSQAEYSPEKVEMARNYQGGNRSILVSEDNHVVDGHHQWKAALDDGKPIKVIRIMAPITRVLMMVHRMPSTSVAASIREDLDDGRTRKEPLQVDQLSEAVLEGLTGVAAEWLAPVRPVFERLAALAMSKHVTDDDFLAALEKAQRDLPEIFDLMDTQALQDAFENAIGSAALAGSVSRYE